MAQFSFKVGMEVGEPKPCFNALRFKTEAEAKFYGNDLMMKWTVPTGFVVEPSDELPNYEIKDNKLVKVEYVIPNLPGAKTPQRVVWNEKDGWK